jgi:hypothetical protein
MHFECFPEEGLSEDQNPSDCCCITMACKLLHHHRHDRCTESSSGFPRTLARRRKKPGKRSACPIHKLKYLGQSKAAMLQSMSLCWKAEEGSKSRLIAWPTSLNAFCDKVCSAFELEVEVAATAVPSCFATAASNTLGNCKRNLPGEGRRPLPGQVYMPPILKRSSAGCSRFTSAPRTLDILFGRLSSL